VRATIEAMPAAARRSGLDLLAGPRPARRGPASEDAQALFRRIADQNSFYGQLAMEELGQQVTIPPRAAPPTPAELARWRQSRPSSAP
jgi:soluble lytic murein transglycosylase